jgi:hypothetical protein
LSQFKFQKIPRSILTTDHPHRLFELVATSIRGQVEDPLYEVNPARVAAVPPAARTVYWIWLFQCEASLNGIEAFTLQALGTYAPQIHAALTAVGAKELVRRLEAAIPHARECDAEFTTLPDQSWFNRFVPVAAFPTLQSVDKGVYPIIDSLDGLVVAFFRSNEDALFEA